MRGTHFLSPLYPYKKNQYSFYMTNELFSQELSVTQVTSLIKKTLEGAFYGLKITGEISNFRPSSTGHWFFALKDKDSMISAVMFKSALWKTGFTPQNGDKVTVTGSIDVWEQRGTYQIKCDTMTKSGNGDILSLLEERKKQFAALGFFDQEHKVALPRFPHCVGVVTSPTGAALQDILQILGRRAPGLDVLILGSAVQGEEAATTIAQRIMEANALQLCDVLIVGRGGGSLEDLLPFSEECVLRAIYDSTIPVISAVGHEIDWALSDYVADMRAPTPSAAAELVSQGIVDLRESLMTSEKQLKQAMEHKLDIIQSVIALAKKEHLSSALLHKIENLTFRLANTSDALVMEEKALLQDKEHRYLQLFGQLQALNPLAILARGYAIVTDEQGKTIKRAKDARQGMPVNLGFADGKVKAVIKERQDGI